MRRILAIFILLGAAALASACTASSDAGIRQRQSRVGRDR
jgi:hypothetical protein